MTITCDIAGVDIRRRKKGDSLCKLFFFCGEVSSLSRTFSVNCARMDNFIDQTLVLFVELVFHTMQWGKDNSSATLRDVQISMKLQYSSAKKAGVAHASNKS